jgi:hypothetical protein
MISIVVLGCPQIKVFDLSSSEKELNMQIPTPRQYYFATAAIAVAVFMSTALAQSALEDYSPVSLEELQDPPGH